jgi:hypothetical protein
MMLSIVNGEVFKDKSTGTEYEAVIEAAILREAEESSERSSREGLSVSFPEIPENVILVRR